MRLCGHAASVLSHEERPWSSITFTGCRHVLTLEFAGNGTLEAADRFITELEEHEFSLPRRLVADARITSVDQVFAPRPRVVVTCDLLLLEDGGPPVSSP
ncbi:hypothetical protein EYB45_04835 [Erythrobacteraceae bacterium CFH 75059]|nr:hypothetical protein EYB45_04835 [Erythrobacteraceae bacterium CFH 75059]